MAQRKILTISEAEAALNLSGPRIHQLLTSGELDGPGLPPGRKRHSPGAPRVSAESVAAYLRALHRDQPIRNRGKRGTAPVDATGGPGGRDTTALAAAQELKVKLDTAREELSRERQRSADLIEVIDKLVGLLWSSQTSADNLDSLADGYSEALTQFLSPYSLADGETAP